MRARARAAMLIGLALLFALFFLARKLGEEDLARPPHDVSNTLTREELPQDMPIDGDGARFGEKGRVAIHPHAGEEILANPGTVEMHLSDRAL